MQVATKLKRMEVRLVDIANELDVSVMTVSRSLRHDRSISPETRARVHEVARRLGYKGSAGKTRRPGENDTKTQSLGLLLRHESLEAAHRDNLLIRMMGGIMSVLDTHGMRLKTHTWPADQWPHLDEDPSALPPMLQEGECRALIVQGYHEERNLDFLSRRMPVVSMGRHYRELPLNAVVADNVDSIHKLVTHLATLGHQRLAWVGTNVTWDFIEARQAGFIQGCLQHGLEITPRFFFGPEIWQGRHIQNTDTLLAAVDAGVTAFVCGNDYVAFHVVEVLKAAGKRLPSDVSVTGFDGSPNQTNIWQTTSIDPGFFTMGKLAAEMALRCIAQPRDEPYFVVVPGKLVPGSTTAPPPGISVAQE
jgi:LacI family transcriptional regulator